MEVFKVTKNLVADGTKIETSEPRKCVKSMSDISAWLRSKAYYDLLGFINGISTAIQGKRLSSNMHVSENMQKLLDIFVFLNEYVDETPPLEQQHRFGNKAYRIWNRRVNQEIFLLLQKAVPEEKCNLVGEMGTYLVESFGNATRIDYGTGHELSFIFFLCSLFKAGVLVEQDNVACALKLFHEYLLFVRRLQTTYRMEPAGSQGVWSLDDFQFVPFIWGSAQLSYEAPFDPHKFLDADIINKYKDEYMFIGCIDYISKVKTGHFAEHSNQLWSISAVPSWSKIYSGLLKMYPKEILSKYPIIQHVYFGKLMPFDPVEEGASLKVPRLGFPVPHSQQNQFSKPVSRAKTDASDVLTVQSTSLTETVSSEDNDGPEKRNTTTQTKSSSDETI